MYVELKHINKTFSDYQASDDVSFGIEKGKLVAFLGPSGSGKTTILRMLAGLEQPDSGDICIDGVRVNDLPGSKRNIGFVFQNYALFRYMTVYDNIAFGLKIRKTPKAKIKERVDELMELTGLKGLERRYPNQLSGGQRQRVAFARALAPNPQLLLLDEPFAAIDAKVRQELRSWLKEMITRLGVTSIFVTHDQEEAIEIADEIFITNKGRIEQMGTPKDICLKPSTLFVAQFVGQSDIIENFHELKGFSETNGIEQAIIRPEYVKVARKKELEYNLSAAEEGVIHSVAFRGSHLELKVEVKGILLTATRSLEEDSIETGEVVDVLIYRLYGFHGSQTYMFENSAMQDVNSVYI